VRTVDEVADLACALARGLAQADGVCLVLRDGSFVHDFLMRDTPRTLHVVNAPSPAATSALPIAGLIVDRVDGVQG